MPISISHTTCTGKLSPIPKDPFDRVLIARPVVKESLLVFCDRIMKKYDVKVVRLGASTC